MAIWKMAQIDPLVLQSPQAQQAFESAGWPTPKLRPMAPQQFMDTVPEGYQGSYGIDPLSGRPTGFKVTPENQWSDVINQLRAAKLKYELEQMGAIPGQQEQPPATPTPSPQSDKGGWWSNLWGGKTASAATPDALVAPPWAALIPATEKWLEPTSAPALQPTASPAPSMPTIPAPTGREQSLRAAMDTLRGRGIGVPMPRAAKSGRTATGTMAKYGKQWRSVAKEPATQQEFEQTVREMAKTDRQKAKAYYDRWVSKWQ
jgi:hypothetical protein